ncbi:hypothetical protein [Cellulophaga tyrosinoxydans]|uniref:Uncharacterized protein n=1 Tax=Cellulophaga tyrosinoxydans TaxID=504486 RepID=A0A1W1YC15_9FLAO|nr:hypothetical protein [Cellulophaga tyrosinoxydans]SMC33689.1 hypothetical protein SAMN05660703_0272 [Cellulophaga tyrosinoxydans]
MYIKNIPEVYTYRRYASNGSTSIYHSQDKFSVFDDQLKIAPDLGRSKAKDKPIFWMNQIDEMSFKPTTGLKKTSSPRWFYGDQKRKKDHLIFEFREDKEYLIIHFFKGFKPISPKLFTEKFIRL